MSKSAAGAGDGELWFRKLFENLPAAIYVADAKDKLIWSNPAMSELVGADSTGEIALDLLLPDGTPLPRDAWPMTHARVERRETGGLEVLIESADGRRTPVIVYSKPWHDDSGAFAGTITLCANISNRKQSEAASRARLSQMIHREKNEIQMIQSLLSGAQREAIHPEAKELLAGVAHRIAAVAAAQSATVHAEAGSFEAQALLQHVAQIASQSFGAKLDLEVSSSAMGLPVRAAVPLAIIASELIGNAVQHAKGERNRVAVRLDLHPENGESVLTVKDDGPGFEPAPVKHRASGFGLVEALARQLGGKLEMTTHEGTCCTVRFRAR